MKIIILFIIICESSVALSCEGGPYQDVLPFTILLFAITFISSIGYFFLRKTKIKKALKVLTAVSLTLTVLGAIYIATNLDYVFSKCDTELEDF